MFPVGRLSCLVGNGGVGKSFTLLLPSLSITDKRVFLPTDNYPLFDDKEVLVIDTENRSKQKAYREGKQFSKSPIKLRSKISKYWSS